MLTDDGSGDGPALREVRASTPAVQDDVYLLRDYPATAQALETGSLVEAHLDDPSTDPAERQVLGVSLHPVEG